MPRIHALEKLATQTEDMRQTPPHPLISKVSAYLAAHAMLDGVRHLGVAVSGGADSIALLHILHALREENMVALHVLHVNHGLRGEEADADEGFVREETARLQLDLSVLRIPPESAPSSGLELWARHRRLSFFMKQMTNLSLERVATGHTERDQAETVLFHLLRGAGPDGLRGILPRSRNGFIRPLLCASRAEVLDFLEQCGIGWREDASNSDPVFARNRLRNQWLPELRRAWNPNLERTLAQTADILAADSDYMETVAEQAIGELFRSGPFGWEAAVSSLRSRHPALLRRTLRTLAARLANTTPEFRHLECLRSLAVGTKRSGRYAFRELLAERSGDAFRLTRLAHSPGASVPAATVAVSASGRYSLPGVPGIVELDILTAADDRMNKFNELNSSYTEGWSLLPLRGAGREALLRRWRPGDTFIEPGSGSRRKLKECFQRSPVPRWRRAAAVVLEVDGEIVWCSYLGTSAPYTIPDTVSIGEFFSPLRLPERLGIAVRYLESVES